MAKAKSKRSFEQQLADLENIISELEKGDLPLEEMLKQYEEGVQLVRACREKLEGAKQSLEQLTPEKPQEDMLF